MRKILLLLIFFCMPLCAFTQDKDVKKLISLGGQAYEIRHFDTAAGLYERALPYIRDKKMRIDVLFMLSSCYLELGNKEYLAAKDDESFYMKSLEYAKECLDLKPDYWYALANIGTVHMNMGDFETAANYFKEAEKFADASDPGYEQLSVFRNAVEERLKLIKEKKDD